MHNRPVYIVMAALALLLSNCVPTGPVPGPDKQAVGTVEGAAVGAGVGAVTGFQLGLATGPGAAVGAGMGAVAGGLQGLVRDQSEEGLLKLAAETKEERRRAFAQEVVSEQLKRRVELHPTRDIYPADLFFYADETKLRPMADDIVREIARINKNRFPWSRLVISAYIKAADEESQYAATLGKKRCQALGDSFVTAGFEARRIETRVVLVKEPLLIDPQDRADRYNQAFELIPADR